MLKGKEKPQSGETKQASNPNPDVTQIWNYQIENLK